MAKKRGFGLGKDLGDPIQIAQTVLDVSEDDPRIKDYLETGGINLDPVTQAWCAEFVNATLAQAGLPTSGSSAARSFMNYGEPVLSPRPGDIAVFKRREDDPDPQAKSKGHAGFYTGEEFPGYLDILGGNQGDAANIMPLDADRLLGFRRPPGTPELPEAQSLTATLPQALAAGVYGADLSRNLNRPGTARGLPGGLGGTVTPRLEAAYEEAINRPRFEATAGVPNAGLPTEWINASLYPAKETLMANWATVRGLGNPSSEKWQGENLTWIEPVKGQRWQVYKPAAAAFEGLLKDLIALGYKPTSSGGFNYRNIRGSDKLSQHAFGTAIDLNAMTNALGQSATDIPQAAELARKWGLEWGGNWQGRPDPMHFEYRGSSAPQTYQVGPGFKGKNPNYVAPPEILTAGLGAPPEEPEDPAAAGREMLAGLGTPMLTDEEMLAMAMEAMKRQRGGQAAAAPQYEIKRTLAEAPKRMV